jgi:choline dehydrogenase-like flavoprotein
VRERTEDARARARPRCEARRLSHGDEGELGVRGRTKLPPAELAKQEKQARTGYTTHPASAHWFVNDLENPYSETKRFDWMRGYHVGGRSLLWGRQSYRLGDLDFEANAREGIAVDWPMRYADIAPWYDYVERFAGISGTRDGLPHLPDGEFLPPMEMNCLEQHVRGRIAEKLWRAPDDHRPGGQSHRSRTWAAATASTGTAVSGAVPTAPISAATPRRCRPPPPPATSRCGRSRSCNQLIYDKGASGRRGAHHRCRDAPGGRVSREGDLLLRLGRRLDAILLNSTSTVFRTGSATTAGSSATI